MNNWKGKTALITGASSGIGTEFARLLAGRGCNVILTARREEKLNALAKELSQNHNVSALVIVQDLSMEGSAQRLFDAISSNGKEVDILINNAGFGMSGRFVNADPKRTGEMLHLNMVSLVELARLLIPVMVKRGSGEVLFTGSIAAFMPVPFMVIYSATKAFVRSVGEALNRELKGTGVNVCVLNPGPVETEFLETASMSPPPYSRMALMSPREVAEIGIRALERKKISVVAGFFNKLLVCLTGLMPLRLKLASVSLIKTFLGIKG